MLLGAALGLNLWLVAMIVPAIVGHALVVLPANGAVALVLLAIACPALLLLGSHRRSSLLLLFVFPLVAVLPLALAGALPSPPWPLVAASLVAYLLAASWGLERAELAGVTAPVEERPLASESIASRWRRRARVYRILAGAAVVLPVGLLWAVDLRSSTEEAISRAFGARAPSVQALLTVAAGLWSLFLFRSYLVPPLESHLQQDAPLRAHLAADRVLARRGRPRGRFYAYVLFALVAMVAVVWERSR